MAEGSEGVITLRPVVQQPPNPVEETVRWCRLNRPDVAEQVAMTKDHVAFAFLISLGFAAGRAFQAVPEHSQVLLTGKNPYAHTNTIT